MFQLVYHIINTSPTSGIKTYHTTASIITLHSPNNFNSQDFNNVRIFNLYLYYLHDFNQYYNFNYYGDLMTQLTQFVHLYSCN
jgi:hypothetical protein